MKPTGSLAIVSEIIRNRLESVTEEMGIVLSRVSRSPLVSEMKHFSTALLNGDGRMVAQAPGNLTHLASIGRASAAALEEFKFDLQDGDVLITNDPYAGGSSLNQMTLLTVTMSGDDLILFPASRVQLTDVGGSQPGGLYPAAYELFQEGDIVPPLRLASGGKVEKDILSRLLKGSRTPGRFRSDINAMMAANRIARRRIEEILDEFGADDVRTAIAEIIEYTERLLRSEFKEWPDGTWIGEATCDHLKGVKATVRATVRIEGDALEIDFTGSSAQVPRFINSPLANTETFSLTAVLNYVRGRIPLNDGIFRSVRISAPSGSVVNPEFPAATGYCGFHVGLEIAEAVASALTRALPERATVPFTSQPTLVLNDQPGSGDRYISQAAIAPGGCGAVFGHDGWGWPGPQSGIDVSSPEIFEQQFGMRMVRRQYLEDSGGGGRWRGGVGSQVVLEVIRDDLVATALVGDRHRTGITGANGSITDGIVLKQGSPDEIIVDSVAYREPLIAGDRIVLIKGGGPGWGSPLERTGESVREDVLDGYVSRQHALSTYGVMLDSALMLDAAATDDARSRSLVHPRHSDVPSRPNAESDE